MIGACCLVLTFLMFNYFFKTQRTINTEEQMLKYGD